MKKIKKLAIANRGEVAVRIINACRELGIETVLLHSEADVNSRAYRLADETQCIGPSPTPESYLYIESNVRCAQQAGAHAIHPGFGFLSENPEFAEAVEKAGLLFVGPRPQTIRDLGDKIQAKKIIEEAKVPTVPGYAGYNQEIPHLIKECEKIGYPVIVKAAAGGGGRGMKVIQNSEEASELIESAQREGLSAFGSSTVFLEKYLDRAKHIEFQVFGDGDGNAVHLYERECSVQRRHQKIIEEAVSPSIDENLRQSMGQSAIALAQATKYRGAGTVEFLVQDNQFYFLEMNTRLQVEHPVTELVLGVDLVKAQIQLADGSFTLWNQDGLRPRGHSIECRIYAENPYMNGMPSTGLLGSMVWPYGPGRRFEVGFEKGDTITSFYDSMIAKVIVWDETREKAIEKMCATLRDCMVFGVHLNIPYLLEILQHPEFVDGSFTTQFIGKNFPEGLGDRDKEPWMSEFFQMAYQEVGGSQLADAGNENNLRRFDPFQVSWSNV